MNKKNDFLNKIKLAAKNDAKLRKDPRYLRAMGFLTRKGFLKANRDFSDFNVGKLFIEDALWAGKKLEPRILEVLPATIARLPHEIVLNKELKALTQAVNAINTQAKAGPDFMGIPFEKYKVWANLQIKDKRTKPINQKKIMRSFRLTPGSIQQLEKQMEASGKSGAEIIENLLAKE